MHLLSHGFDSHPGLPVYRALRAVATLGLYARPAGLRRIPRAFAALFVRHVGGARLAADLAALGSHLDEIL